MSELTMTVVDQAERVRETAEHLARRALGARGARVSEAQADLQPWRAKGEGILQALADATKDLTPALERLQTIPWDTLPGFGRVRHLVDQLKAHLREIRSALYDMPVQVRGALGKIDTLIEADLLPERNRPAHIKAAIAAAEPAAAAARDRMVGALRLAERALSLLGQPMPSGAVALTPPAPEAPSSAVTE